VTTDQWDKGIRIIALSGELGSGKSSVSWLLAEALGARRVSTGEAQRQIAESRGITTLELNRLAEIDATIDEEIDSVFRSLAGAGEPLVVDSRLAWHFLPHAFKVHLVVDPGEAARRVLARRDASAERYRSLAEAEARIGERVESERRRFQQIYGIDIFALANYDLVVDTSEASPDEVAGQVLARFSDAGKRSGHPALLLAPGRIEQTGRPEAADGEGRQRLVEEMVRDGYRLSPITVSYQRPTFSLLDGAKRLDAARGAGLVLVPAVLGPPPEVAVSGR
jgi:CMP/dCMP kinase